MEEDKTNPPVSISHQAPHQFAIQVGVSCLIGAATVIMTVLTVNWQIKSSSTALEKQLQASSEANDRQIKSSANALDRQLKASESALDRQITASFEVMEKQTSLQNLQWSNQHAVDIAERWHQDRLRISREFREAFYDWVGCAELFARASASWRYWMALWIELGKQPEGHEHASKEFDETSSKFWTTSMRLQAQAKSVTLYFPTIVGELPAITFATATNGNLLPDETYRRKIMSALSKATNLTRFDLVIPEVLQEHQKAIDQLRPQAVMDAYSNLLWKVDLELSSNSVPKLSH